MPDPTKVPQWQTVGQQTLDDAAAAKKPIVLFFPGEGEQYGDFYVYGDDYAALANESASFVRIPFTANRDKAPDTGSPVPTSKLLSDNPSRDYGVTVNKPTFIVADWHGNVTAKLERKASASELKGLIGKVQQHVDVNSKKLQRNYDSAKAAWDKKESGEALKAIYRNFKEGLVGLEAQENSIKLYNEIMEATCERISELAEKGDLEGLRSLSRQRELRGTEAAKAAEEALNNLRNPTTQEKKDAAAK